LNIGGTMRCTRHKKVELERDVHGVAFCRKCQEKEAKQDKPRVPFYDDEPICAVRQKASKIGKGWDANNGY